MTSLHDTAVRCLARVLRLGPAQAAALDPDDDLALSHGMTSLDSVLFMTSLCEAVGVPLTRLDDNDLAAVKSLRDSVQLMARKQTQLEREHALETTR